MGRKPKQKELKPADIVDSRCSCFEQKWNDAQSIMKQRTKMHKFFTKVAHMQSLYETRNNGSVSEGSTQAIKRKIRAQTIQRVPDGEIVTQYDKNSIEQAEIEFIFKHKIISSEFDGKDMLKNLWRLFNSSYDYGYGCALTEFKDDADGDIRISFKHVKWNDIYPAPDCDFIEEAPWYIVREYVSKSDLKQLISDSGTIEDSTYNEDTLRYIVQNDAKSAIDPLSIPLADEKNGVTPIESIEIRTMYERGKDTFVTWVPSLDAVLREVPNYDPRKEVPIHFLVLEPDAEFPLGCSSIMWTLQQQQFADAFQTLSYDTLLLASEPPLMAFGNLTNAKIRLKPRSIWQMGNNQNAKVEKFPVETTTLTQYGAILQNVSANMMKNLNITDSTIASDAQVMNYSGTPQGVEQQKADKTITVNQYQKRVEIFFQEWANHALRSYLSSMGGVQKMTVDEQTRRRIFDWESSQMDDQTQTAPVSIISDNKISIDFDELSSDMLEFIVRVGSLIESEKEQEMKSIQQLLVTVSQMLGALSDRNREAFEKVIMQLVSRLCELSNIDISQQTANEISDALMQEALQETMKMVLNQQNQIAQMQGMLGQGQPAIPEGQLPMPEGGPTPPTAGDMPQVPAEVSAEFPEPGPGQLPVM